jgi:membrane-bound serine protease (ClpP class)
VVLIGLAFIFFILDIKVTGFALTVAGAISFILGSLFLFSPFAPGSPSLPRLVVNPWLLVGMTILLVGFFSFALTAGLRAQRREVLMSRQALVDATGIALSNLDPQGVVQIQSETWTAMAEEPIKAGEKIKVIASDGLYLRVCRAS